MLEDLLKEYKKNKTSIELLQIKIKEWEETLTKSAYELNEENDRTKTEFVGSRTNKVSDPTLGIVISAEVEKEKINTLIEKGKDKILLLRKKNELVDTLLNSLDEESLFIVEQKFFEKRKWQIITYQFNVKYRNKYNEYLTMSGIRKKYNQIKKELTSLLEIIEEK